VVPGARNDLRLAMLVGVCMLFVAGMAPRSAYSHDPVPVLPDEDTEETVPERDDAGDAVTTVDSATSDEEPEDAMIDHAAHGRMADAAEADTGERVTTGTGLAGHGAGAHGDEGMVMTHPGLPVGWIIPVVLLSAGFLGWAVVADRPLQKERRSLNTAAMPVLGPVVAFVSTSPVPLLILKVITAIAFVLVLVSGFFGTVYPERSLATVLVWNWWWPLVVVAVLFVGTAWCAICPWDSLASWIVRRRFWRRAFPHPGLNRPVPKYLRNVWLALALFIGLTWLELGVGVTSAPKSTAIMALAMFGLSFLFLVFFERKAFCRYGCPVGRTIGYYSRLAPIALRPKEQSTCDTCKTMECYRGSEQVEPCPTSLTIGKFSQNTYCLSCGNCVFSCPHDNVTWRLRPMGSEAMSEAPPTLDGAWFMLLLLSITTFHGLTMLPVWTDLIIGIAGVIGETGRLVWSFTFGMLGGMLAPVLVYAAAIGATMYTVGSQVSFRQLFIALAFPTLPLAFTYHLAHNLDHLFREGSGIMELLLNPLGTGLPPLTMAEQHAQMSSESPDQLVFALQAGLMVLGVWLAVYILRHRAARVMRRKEGIKGWRLLPMLAFIAVIAGANLWLLAQNMVMRF